jgi:ATP/ADP translocase
MTIFLLDFNRLLTEYAPTESGKTEWGARRSLLENGLGILIQLGITPVLLKRYGPGPGLVVLPLLAMAGGLAMASQEVFLVGFAVIAGTQGVAYTLNQSSKELLYVPTDRSLKYQAKALVDVFCFRLGQVVASLLVLGWRSLFPKTYWPLLLLAIGASVAWLGFARAAGRAFNEATREKPGNPVPACEAGGASGA